MEFKEIIDKVISLPGHFIVFKDKNTKKEKANSSKELPLCISKDCKKANSVFEVFSKSKKNSMELLNEAEILLKHKSYARAVALAIMSYEELGKSQIVADYYSGVLPESEYKKAFKRHEKTAYTSRYAAIGSHEKVKHGYYVDKNIAKTLEQIRQSALYVDENNNPSENFTEEDVILLINKVKEHHEAIMHAEWLNGRIGSKALFK